MRRMIKEIEQSHQAQLFISTHSDLISTRLDLRNCILMNSAEPVGTTSLRFIDAPTAKFFMKAPDNNILQFVMSPKVLLVEGDAEFILMDAFCKKVLGHTLFEQGIDVIAVDGKCFKRYLEIAKCLGNKVAVITDNDKNYAENITAAYNGYINNEFANIRVYADNDIERYTFELSVYRDNTADCDNLFGADRRSLTVVDYMLSNKAEAAYKLLTQKEETLIVPHYIREALIWVNA